MSSGRVVIVGGGLAGLRTAERLRRMGHTGPVTLIGAEPWHPYDRPPLSKGLLVKDEEPAPVLLRPIDAYAELDLDLRLGTRAIGLDPRTRCVALHDGSEVRYDRLVIATGARARTIPEWQRFANVYVLRTWEDCLSLRFALRAARHVTVVGAGVLGCEIAASARALGLAVTLLDELPSPMLRVLGPRLGGVAAELHRSHGVDVRVGCAVERLDGDTTVEAVVTRDGDRIPTDLVVLAIGSVPETEWLAESGVDIDDGVVCDATGKTSLPDVYAVGDVARMPYPGSRRSVRLEHWTSAADTATLVASNLLAPPGQERTLSEVPYFWSDQYDVKIQGMGVPEADDELVIATGELDARRFLALYVSAGRVQAAVTMNMPAALARCRTAVATHAPIDELLEQAPWTPRRTT
jgi:3-phenylpropionate/trans-cinnamate dioxygenase ferredoxin reductase subunit